MSPDEIQVRRDICRDCARECLVRDAINPADACAECPLRVWHTHANCGKDEPSIAGLGDVVALAAQPIARFIDRATGGRTNVAGCGGCKARKASLNKAVPFS